MSYAYAPSGKLVLIGFQDHELLWIRAAASLTRSDRLAAYADISSMTGRPFASIQRKAESLLAEDRIKAKQFLQVCIPPQRGSKAPVQRYSEVMAVGDKYLANAPVCVAPRLSALMGGSAKVTKAKST